MYIACLCPNLVSVHFYAIPILHFKFYKFLFTCNSYYQQNNDGQLFWHNWDKPSRDGGLSIPVFVLLLYVLCVLCRTRPRLWCWQLEEVTQMWYKYYWVDKMWTSTWEIRFVPLNRNGHLLSHMSLHIHVAIKIINFRLNKLIFDTRDAQIKGYG